MRDFLREFRFPLLLRNPNPFPPAQWIMQGSMYSSRTSCVCIILTQAFWARPRSLKTQIAAGNGQPSSRGLINVTGPQMTRTRHSRARLLSNHLGLAESGTCLVSTQLQPIYFNGRLDGPWCPTSATS